jgi:hypothetical protein
VGGWYWFRLLDVPVEVNTGLKLFTEPDDPDGQVNPYVIRRAPFRVYDAMSPIEETVPVAATPLALRLHVPVATGARPGRRRYRISLRSGRQSETLMLTVRVHRAAVPAVGEKSFPYTNYWSYENIATRHGLKLWSAPFWAMLRQYADLMACARQNVMWVPWHVMFTRTPGGLVLDRARLRRIVKVCTAAGLYWIEGGHLADRGGREFKTPTFDLALYPGVRATSDEGAALLAGALRQLTEEIDRNGWRQRWLQHTADEPSPGSAADFRALNGMVRRYMPGAVLLEATLTANLAGSLDVWCPQVQNYQHKRKRFAAARARGDRVWCYTCCAPGGPWLNRLLDGELLRPALIAWAIGLFRLDGFLHWGLNMYRPHQDPFEETVMPIRPGGKALPPGDTHVVYPGPDGPWSSLRLESHREGFEDLELLRHLQGRSPEAADRIVRMAVQGFDRYVRTARRLRTARRALLEAVNG